MRQAMVKALISAEDVGARTRGVSDQLSRHQLHSEGQTTGKTLCQAATKANPLRFCAK